MEPASETPPSSPLSSQGDDEVEQQRIQNQIALYLHRLFVASALIVGGALLGLGVGSMHYCGAPSRGISKVASELILLACPISILVGLVLAFINYMRIRLVLSPMLRERSEIFSEMWENLEFTAGPGNYVELQASGKCAYCRSPPDREESVTREKPVKPVKVKIITLFGLLSHLGEAMAEGRRARGVRIAYPVCRACKPAPKKYWWTRWAGLAGTVSFVLLFAGFLIAGNFGKASDIYPFLAILLGAVGWTLFFAARTVTTWSPLVTIEQVKPRVVILGPRHLTVRKAKLSDA